MADLPGDFWSGWIIVITVVSFMALVWLVFNIYFFSNGKLAQHDGGQEPVWDENLREGSNAPPLWWFWLILSAMVFTVIYLILYPGLGSFKGVLNWSQDSRLQSSYDTYEAQFGDKRKAIAESSLASLQNNPALMDTAERIFSRNCAACHGPDGRGQSSLFPNLKDIDWQWGGSAEQIEQTIRLGRSANMISWQAVLGDENVANVTDYVLALGTGEADQHPGKVQYMQFCIGCHGVDGKGNILLGAPDLSDDSWLYGGSVENVRISISQGRNGIMPAFGERLDDAQIKMLVAWLAR
jgi:cytochrome c oxidase cbb3-type subunit 3